MTIPRRWPRAVTAAAFLAAVTALAGCARTPPPAPKKGVLDVFVAEPIVHPVTDAEDFTGRTEAFRYVEIRPQVTGKLMKIHFKDGDFVREGAPLFEIDRRVYLAQRNSAKATLDQAKARLIGYEASLSRAELAWKQSVIGKEEYDTKRADRDAGIAAVEQAQANLDLAEQNLDWTRIYAEYTGRLSRRMLDPGNIAKANDTILTTLIVTNPVYIGFDIDEQTLERRREAIREGRIASAREEKLEVQVGLGHQEGYPFTATVTFADNQLDAGTGTLHIRAEMQNPILKLGALPAVVGVAAALDAEQRGLRLLSPGMFVRVRLPMGKPHDSLMVPEEAIGSDQGHKFVYAVNEKNEVVYRRVELGPQVGNLRAINERPPQSKSDNGVARGERVIVSGQQRVKAGDKVNPKPFAPTAHPTSLATH